MGLGLLGGGVGTVKFFVKEGAQVLITDKRNSKDLRESLNKIKRFPVKLVLGKHRKEDFKNCDLIIKNPAVPNNSPYLEIARKNDIPIKTDIDIFFDLCKVPVIGVTGTKGKSTVATLIYLFLKNKHPATINCGAITASEASGSFLAGNIGVSPLEILSKLTKKSKVVLELSSFELENLTKSPKIAIITNIFPDHFDRYKSFRDYIKAKEPIFRYQKEKDILVLNYDNFQTRKFAFLAPSSVYFFSKNFACPSSTQALSARWACLLKDGKIYFNNEKKYIFDIKNLKLYGEHNISNILAAVSVAKILRISSKTIKKVLIGFRGISNRQEFILKWQGVKYFNDTTATTPQSTIAAIRTFSQRFSNSKIILIAGGQDKNLDYKNLAKEIQKRINFLVLLAGTASDKLKKELKAFKKISFVNSMKGAIKEAVTPAQKGDIVLFSPGAASFNLFKNEFERGEKFRQALQEIIARPAWLGKQ